MKKNGISRRDFLKGAAAGMAALGLAGCTATGTQTTGAPEGTKAPETTATPKVEVNQSVPVESTPEYEVYHTELLIIGTGSAATWATQRALEAGKKIMMVDKGVFRHSGASAMSWDA